MTSFASLASNTTGFLFIQSLTQSVKYPFNVTLTFTVVGGCIIIIILITDMPKAINGHWSETGDALQSINHLSQSKGSSECYWDMAFLCSDTHPHQFSFLSCLLTFQRGPDSCLFLFLVNVYLVVARLFMLTGASGASLRCRYDARVIPDVAGYPRTV